LSETFLILRITERDMINKFRLVVMKYIRYSCAILMNLTFSHQLYEKFSNIKFHDNLFSGRRVVPCEVTDGRTDRGRDGQTTDGRMDRYNEANSHS
jgi:hypothetical protein